MDDYQDTGEPGRQRCEEIAIAHAVALGYPLRPRIGPTEKASPAKRALVAAAQAETPPDLLSGEVRGRGWVCRAGLVTDQGDGTWRYNRLTEAMAAIDADELGAGRVPPALRATARANASLPGVVVPRPALPAAPVRMNPNLKRLAPQ